MYGSEATSTGSCRPLPGTPLNSTLHPPRVREIVQDPPALASLLPCRYVPLLLGAVIAQGRTVSSAAPDTGHPAGSHRGIDRRRPGILHRIGKPATPRFARSLCRCSLTERSGPGHDGRVRIETSPGSSISNVYLFLTRAEAKELRDALNDLLHHDDEKWHSHVSSEDYQTEIAVAWDSATDR